MNNHEKSEQARSFVCAWTEQNEQLIKTWLKGTKSIQAVGADLIRFMLDASMENGALDLRGIQGPFIESLFRHAPGGEIAARQFFAERIESGEEVPKEFQKLCAELLRNLCVFPALRDHCLGVLTSSRVCCCNLCEALLGSRPRACSTMQSATAISFVCWA